MAEKQERPGADVSFPYDRLTVERFRKRFPRARWSDDRQTWFIPGKTAARRFDRWLAYELSGLDVHADQKGRDAFAFEPIASKYLVAGDDHLEVDTPYSRTVVQQMREVPFARWDADRRVWAVPYGSYEALHRRWSRIEAAARRNEPEERRKRRSLRRDSAEEIAARARRAERRRRRHPLDPDDLPPFGRPVMTSRYGIVVFVGCSGEIVDERTLAAAYPELPSAGEYVWGHWRPASLDELVRTWPSRARGQHPPADAVWWQPTIEELRIARKAARSLEQRRKRAAGPDERSAERAAARL